MNGERTPSLFITINIHIEKQTSEKRNEWNGKCRTERNNSSSDGSDDKEKDDNDDDDDDEMTVNRRKYTRISHTSTHRRSRQAVEVGKEEENIFAHMFSLNQNFMPMLGKLKTIFYLYVFTWRRLCIWDRYSLYLFVRIYIRIRMLREGERKKHFVLNKSVSNVIKGISNKNSQFFSLSDHL